MRCLKFCQVTMSSAFSTGKKPTSRLSGPGVGLPPVALAKNNVLQIDRPTFWKMPQNLMICISIPDSSFVSRIAASRRDSPSSTCPPGISQPRRGPLISKISLLSLNTTVAAETICFGGAIVIRLHFFDSHGQQRRQTLVFLRRASARALMTSRMSGWLQVRIWGEAAPGQM